VALAVPDESANNASEDEALDETRTSELAE
jgi:hypothetical protein